MRGTTRECQNLYHAKCYLQLPSDKFPVLRASDLDNALLDDNDPGEQVDDDKRFQESREGDILMCPFQCDDCLFYNLKSRYPTQDDGADNLLLLCIRRANLDAFWSQERSTVNKNKTEMASFLDSATLLGIRHPLPNRVPFPVGDTFGMGTVCAMLLKTLRAGKNSTQIQFETARKVRSTVSNFVHTAPDGVGLATISTGEQGRLVFSGSSTNSMWFKHFLTGCHQRMGDLWIPDRALRLDEVLGCLEILETDYTTLVQGGQQKLEICLTSALLVVGYTAALRGEEIPQVDLGMMRKY
ncbi:hypothetical protein ACA910_009500 [Epithemia clementina (nom. ined.)]